MDYSLRGSSVHGVSQARILEWVAFSSSRDASGGHYLFLKKSEGRGGWWLLLGTKGIMHGLLRYPLVCLLIPTHMSTTVPLLHSPSVPIDITIAKDEILTLWNLQQDRWQHDGRKEYTECLIDLPASPWMEGNKNVWKIRKKKVTYSNSSEREYQCCIWINSSFPRTKLPPSHQHNPPNSPDLKILQFYLHIKAARYRISQ